MKKDKFFYDVVKIIYEVDRNKKAIREEKINIILIFIGIFIAGIMFGLFTRL